MAALPADAASIAETKRRLNEFLDMTNEDSPYRVRIKTMMDGLKLRLIVHLTHLRDWDPDMARRFFTHPVDMIPVLEAAVKDVSVSPSPSPPPERLSKCV